jgi:purine-binding chemotaxis protein CheW
MMARRDEIKFIMGAQDPNLLPLKKVWLETMQLATRAAELFEDSSMSVENSMTTVGGLVSGLRAAMEKTRALSKSAGKVLERSYILVFELAGNDYCFHVDTVQEVVAPKGLVALPKMPFFMKGVMEHRQQVIPIIDPAEIMGIPPAKIRRRLILVRKNGDSIALVVDRVKQIVPVVSGYFRQPKVNEPLLKMVYEDGTRKIRMLDARLVLEEGLRRAFNYSHNVNGRPGGGLHDSSQSRLSGHPEPNPPLHLGSSMKVGPPQA